MSVSTLWHKIANFVHGAEAKVADVFIKIFGADASHKFAQGALALLKTAEGKIVLDAVEFAETLATDGAGKRAAAFEKIVADFKAQGKEVSGSLINMAVELAVQFLKGNIATA